MSLSSLQSYAEDYFSSLNSIAERISADVAVTKNAYENLWHTLSYKDQSQVINETIIYPEAVLKYSYHHPKEADFECYPRLRLQTGDKYVLDEEAKRLGSSWRDEHSAPFTWMTQSQLNLCINEDAEQEKQRLNFITLNALPLKKESRSPEKKITAHASVSFLDPPSIVLGGSSSKMNAAQSSRLKCPITASNTDDSLLSKLKNKTTVLRIHTVNTSTNKNVEDNSACKAAAEKKNLVKSKNTYVLVSGAKAPKSGTGKHVISKPKTPPPPPPPTAKQKSQNVPNSHADSEKIALLQETCVDNLDILPLKLENKAEESTHFNDSKDSLNSFHIELQTPSSNDIVPKTGFDFLDNW